MLKDERFNDILRQTELKFGRGSSKNWINRDFEDLSFQIKRSSKYTISALTLKRIFGKIQTSDDYLPQKATQQALEIYAEYKENKVQVDSINANEIATEDSEEDKQILDTESNTNTQSDLKTTETRSKKRTSTYLLILATIAACILIIFVFRTKNDTNTLRGSIKLIKTEGENPKTAFFEYTTPNTTDSFKILFDEEYPAVYIPNGTGVKSTYYFQYPGLFKVRMMHNYQAISDTISVFVPSNGWQASAYYFDQKYSERYFPIDLTKCFTSGTFHPTKKVLSASSLDTSRIAVVRLDNFKKTGVNGDNFTLNTTLKNPDQWSGIRCNSIFLYVQGSTGTIRFRFANPGCSYWIDYILSEKTITNKNKDLSDFTFNINYWQQFRFENQNKKVALYINNKLRFTDTYQKSIGEIVGVTVLFHGNGYLKNYSLIDNKEKELFKLEP